MKEDPNRNHKKKKQNKKKTQKLNFSGIMWGNHHHTYIVGVNRVTGLGERHAPRTFEFFFFLHPPFLCTASWRALLALFFLTWPCCFVFFYFNYFFFIIFYCYYYYDVIFFLNFFFFFVSFASCNHPHAKVNIAGTVGLRISVWGTTPSQ